MIENYRTFFPPFLDLFSNNKICWSYLNTVAFKVLRVIFKNYFKKTNCLHMLCKNGTVQWSNMIKIEHTRKVPRFAGLFLAPSEGFRHLVVPFGLIQRPCRP